MRLDDFKNIDIKTAGNLPIAVRLVLVLILYSLVVGVGYSVLWTPSLKELEVVTSKEQGLKNTLNDKRQVALNLKDYQQQIRDVEKILVALIKQLPDKSQVDGLLTDINQAGSAQGLVFDYIKPLDEKIADFYAEKPIAIRVVGTYHQFGHFAEEISKLSRIVTLNDVVVTPLSKEQKENKENKEGQLTMEAVAKTYRYLDANELVAKKQALKDTKK